MAKVTIFENGLPIQVEDCFVDSLCEQQPNKYTKEKPAAKKKVPVEDLTKGNGAAGNTDFDGEFTKEDLEKLNFNGIKEICKKLEIPFNKKKKEVLIEEIWTKTQAPK